MAVQKYLDASTGYVTQDDMDLLDSRNELYCIASYAEGAFVFLPTRKRDGSFEDAGWRELVSGAGFSDRFCDLMAYAAKHDCGLIRLDCDGAEDITGLTLIDW